LRGKDFGAGIPVHGADAANDRFGLSMVKMPTVSGQERIDTVDFTTGHIFFLNGDMELHRYRESLV
jgi:hypothetical protein